MASIGTLTAFLGLNTKGLKKGQDEAKSVIGSMKGLIGGLGIAMSAAGAWKLYEGFEKDSAAIAQVDRAIKATGGSAKTAASAVAQMSQAVTKLGADEVLANQALASLITKTQDAEASVANFGLVQDVAAKFGMDLGSASDAVGKAMSGQFKSLTQLLPYMKTWAASHKELAGTTKGATLALEEMNRVAGGEAEKKAATALGQIQRFKTLQAEMLDEVGRMMTGSEDADTAWKSIADSAERFLRSMQAVKGAPIIQNLSKWAAGIGYMVSGDFLHPGETRGGGSIDKSLYANYGGAVGTGGQFPGLPSSVLASGVGPVEKQELLASNKTGEEDTSEEDAAARDAADKKEQERQDAITKAEQDANEWYMYWKQAADDQIQYQSDLLAAQVSTYDQLLSESFQTVEEMTAAWEKYKAARLKQIDEEVAARVKAANLSPAEADALRFSLTMELNRKGNEAFASRAGIGPDAEAKKQTDNWVKIADDGFRSIGEAATGFFTTQKGQWADFHQSLKGMLASFVGTVLKQLADQALGGGSTETLGASVVGFVSGLFGDGGGGDGELNDAVNDTSWWSEPMIPVAAGGIVSSPTRALIGEAGPEAVIPLDRFRDANFMSRLAGTGTDGPGGQRQGRPVVINIQTQDPQSFKASSSQIAARMALAVRAADRRL